MPDKTVAIVQSNYIPWKGYFDMMRRVDEFILFDDTQYTRRDWRNRNKLKSPGGMKWLTIPVVAKGRYHQRIDETIVSDPNWGSRHWACIIDWYREAPCLDYCRPTLEPAYRQPPSDCLSVINRQFLEVIADLLQLKAKFSWSADYATHGVKTERLINICKAAGANAYLSGPTAKAYLDERRFEEEEIEVRWMTYDGYREYPQLHPPFVHEVSVLDLLLNAGPDASSYLQGSS